MTVLPRWSSETMPYWNGLKEGRLLFNRCRCCGAAVFFPRAICPYCFGRELDWVESAGRGAVYSFTVQYRAARPELQGGMPIVLGIAELDEGYFMFTEFLTADPDSLRIGDRVHVEFHRQSDALVLAKFAPVAGE